MIWILLTTVQLLVPLTTTESPSTLTCNVNQQPDGSFLYHLSHPSSSGCTTCWEDQEKIVLTRDNKFNTNLVQNLTEQSLTLKDCQDYMHYTKVCMGVWQDAHCRINCSLFLDPQNAPPTTVNSTLICFSESWCMTPLKFGLGVAGIIAVVAIIVVVLRRKKICKVCRRRGSEVTRASYTPANGQILMGQEGMGLVKT